MSWSKTQTPHSSLIPRKQWLHPDMTENLLTGMLNYKTTIMDHEKSETTRAKAYINKHVLLFGMCTACEKFSIMLKGNAVTMNNLQPISLEFAV